MTVPHPDMEINTQILYREYKNWCKENGEFQYNERRFKAEMPKKGYPVRKDRNEGEVYVGLKLSTDNKGFIFGE
jgi:phage/plasmid-associated DNA primase